MKTLPCCSSKWNTVLTIIVTLMLICAIVLPVYISTLDGQTDTSNPHGSTVKPTQGGQHQQQTALPYDGQTDTSNPRGSTVSPTPGGHNQQQTVQHYSSDGGLQFKHGYFLLDGKQFRIVSGAFHYFRTVPERWPDVFSKMKALGLNTVETYVPWNLHEETPGKFNFDGMLDVRKFIQIAHDLGLYVIFRPGPYICSEWDFGGLPAWLLSDPDMKVRSNYHGYTAAVKRYFNELLPLVTDLQYSKGGPIIAFQVENEFGSYSSEVEHLIFIKNLFIQHGFNELFLTSDNIAGIMKDVFYKEALPTANFKDFEEGRQLFDQIRNWSLDFPLMVTEFWTGWFDHWTSQHSGLDVQEYSKYLTSILEANASINFYMFHGGTNFGFMNGANRFDTYKPDVTSYDYDALLSEAGDITPKYMKTRELLMKYIFKPQGITTLPDIPGDSLKSSYDSVKVSAHVPFEKLLQNATCVTSHDAVAMEMLKQHDGYGQNYGYILYRSDIPADTTEITFSKQPTDRAQIMVDGSVVGVIDWRNTNLTVQVPEQTDSSKAARRLDILVENHGRVNYATEESGILNNERKGVHGSVLCNGKEINKFTIYPLEFKPDDISSVQWVQGTINMTVPSLFKATMSVTGEPKDTFVYMKGWGKGIVFVNGFNLGRYWSAGPQQTLYLPAQVLQQGDNQVVFFEHEQLGSDIMFLDTPILDVNDPSTIHL